MAFVKCKSCGTMISDKAKACPKCGVNNVLSDIKEKNTTASITQEPANSAPKTPSSTPINSSTSNKTSIANKQANISSKKEKKAWLIGILIAVILLLVAGGVGGYFYYQNVYLPEKIDREAPRTYPIVNLHLRSSKMAGGDFNKVVTVPFGGELITYENDGEWAKVKYKLPGSEINYEGFVASPYLLDKKDFYILNSLFGDDEVREELATAKIRRALLDYFKKNGYGGKLSQEFQSEIGISIPESNQWQVIFHHGQTKPNEVFFKRIVDNNSKFTDMAVLIENLKNQSRKALIFHFDDDETPHLIHENSNIASTGDIKEVQASNGSYTVILSDTGK